LERTSQKGPKVSKGWKEGWLRRKVGRLNLKERLGLNLGARVGLRKYGRKRVSTKRGPQNKTGLGHFRKDPIP